MERNKFNLLGIMVRLHGLAHKALLAGRVGEWQSLRNGIAELERIYQSLA